MPRSAPGSRQAVATMSSSSTNSVGIIIFEAFSMPPFTPRAMTACVAASISTVHSTGFSGCVSKSVK